jgi:hypothetical protein
VVYVTYICQFFLATPHQETESSPWADLLFNIALASTENTPTKREELLTSVRESGSAAVIDASERFYTFASQYQILSFYETKATEFMGSVVSFHFTNHSFSHHCYKNRV